MLVASLVKRELAGNGLRGLSYCHQINELDVPHSPELTEIRRQISRC